MDCSSLGVEFQKAKQNVVIQRLSQEENEEQYARPKCTLNSNCWIKQLKKLSEKIRKKWL